MTTRRRDQAAQEARRNGAYVCKEHRPAMRFNSQGALNLHVYRAHTAPANKEAGVHYVSPRKQKARLAAAAEKARLRRAARKAAAVAAAAPDLAFAGPVTANLLAELVSPVDAEVTAEQDLNGFTRALDAAPPTMKSTLEHLEGLLRARVAALNAALSGLALLRDVEGG